MSNTVRAGYFVRGEPLPEELDPRYDVIVVPWRSLWQNEDVSTLRGYQRAGIAVHVHVPFCYIHPTHAPDAHCAIRAVLDEHDGWLLGAEGQLVSEPWHLIDPRSAVVRRELLRVHMDLLRDAQWSPDGLFLDFLLDRVAWRHEFDGMPHEQKVELNQQCKLGLYRFATGFKFQTRKAGLGLDLYGNGWHRCAALDGIAYEEFPRTSLEDDHRGLDIALWGQYGKTTWELFRRPPMLLPAGGENIADNIPLFRVIEAVAFANSYCPGAVVFDNEGAVFEAIACLA